MRFRNFRVGLMEARSGRFAIRMKSLGLAALGLATTLAAPARSLGEVAESQTGKAPSAIASTESAKAVGEAYISPYRSGGSAIPVIDADLNKWRSWPGSVSYASEAQIVGGKDKWKGPKDLSGTAWTAWDKDFLYLAADVKSTQVIQRERGPNIWRGDHIEVFLDTEYKKGQSGPFGKGQFHILLSPGNFMKTKDPFTDISCESVVFFPKDVSGASIKIASQRTADGYWIETGIPWEILGVSPKIGSRIGIDICLSNSDPVEGQKTMMSILTSPWLFADRSRLMEMTLGDFDCKVDCDSSLSNGAMKASELDLFAGKKVMKNEPATVEFDAPETPSEMKAILSFMARIEWQNIGGIANALAPQLNETAIAPNRLANRPLTFVMPNYKEASSPVSSVFSNSDASYALYYAPKYMEIKKDHVFYIPEWGDTPYTYEFDVTGLIKKKKNQLVFKTPMDLKVSVDDCKVLFRKAEKHEKKVAKELDFIQPGKSNKADYSVEISKGGGFKISIGEASYNVESQFSEPDSKWCKLNVDAESEGWRVKISQEEGTVFAIGKSYSLKRQIKKLDECVEVQDTLFSDSQENVGVIIRHMASMQDAAKVHLNGYPIPSFTATASAAQNPTTFFAGPKGSVGFMPEDDVFRVHSQNFFLNDVKTGGIADERFVLRPGTSYTFKWSIYPSRKTDYYDFVNAVRRKIDVNFTLPGFSYIRIKGFTGGGNTKEGQDTDRVAKFIGNVGLQWLCAGGGFSLFSQKEGRQQNPWEHNDKLINVDEHKELYDRLRGRVPALKMFAYFHMFICTENGAPERFKDSICYGADGKQLFYSSNKNAPLFIPTLENSFGKEVQKDIDIILDECTADGVFWDEMEFSAARYSYKDPWDGFTGSVNPSTHNIEGLMSSTILLSQPLRMKMLDRIFKEGKLVVGNEEAQTETMTKCHFPRFAELAGGVSGEMGHLYTPITLGTTGGYINMSNKVNERVLAVYREMLKSLDQGNLYYWGHYYENHVEPSQKTLCAYMFPFTPIELHKGYLIGKERIVTAVPGKFGWGDRSQHEVHVFNENGVEVERKAATVEKDGAVFTELALPEFYSAAILRK